MSGTERLVIYRYRTPLRWPRIQRHRIDQGHGWQARGVAVVLCGYAYILTWERS